MKKSSIIKLVLLTVFLITFFFNSSVYSIEFSVNEDQTYNLILPPIPHQDIEKIVIKVVNNGNNDESNQRYFTRNVNPGKFITLENFELNIKYTLTTTFHTKDNRVLKGNSTIIFITTLDPHSREYSLEYLIILDTDKEQQAINTNDNSENPNLKSPAWHNRKNQDEPI